jgi:tRNA threonylcarbamoyladenosine biosynthesis protein TsaE
MISPGAYLTHSPEETFALAMEMGEAIDSSILLLLKGDLGAGKTIFAKGLAAGLGIDPAEVSSPTYSILHRYPGRLTLYHLDLYRLAGTFGELESLGWQELIEEPRTVIIVEWPERVPALWYSGRRCRIELVDLGGESRQVSVVISEEGGGVRVSQGEGASEC